VTPAVEAVSSGRDGVIVNEDRSGALLVRVWLEDGTDEFRARVTRLGTRIGQSGDEGVTVALASSPDAVFRSVHAWLDEFLDRAGDPD
jgi:hypothetical protein